MSNRVPARFPIRFDGLYSGLSQALLLSPQDSYVDVTDRDVTVRMGWAFRATFPRTAIESVRPAAREPLSRGVHGFMGRWLVNGSGKGIVTLALAPTQRGYVMGFPVNLRELSVSVDNPELVADVLMNS